MAGLLVHGVANGCTGRDMLYHSFHGDPPGYVRPMPSHSDSMNLDSLHDKDFVNPQKTIQTDSPCLRKTDVPGAVAEYAHKNIYRDGPLDKEFIFGTKSKSFYAEHNKPTDLSLTTVDIEKAQPQVDKFRTSRQTNPLNPQYDLPSSRVDKPLDPPVRFHEGRPRNSMEFKGETKPRILERNYARNPNDIGDIDGSRSTARNKFLSQCFTPRDNVDKTVERAGQRILSTKGSTPRTSCPLDPVYAVSNRSTHPFLQGEALVTAGAIEKSTPRVLHKANGEPQASLIRADLPGAVPQRFKGGKLFSLYDPPDVTPFSTSLQLQCKDIEGTQTGSRTPGTRL